MRGDQRSAREILYSLHHDRGISQVELARMLGRSPRMVRKVLRGESSGEAYRAALLELENRGRIKQPPPRRRNAAGQLVPVRAKRRPPTRPSTPAQIPDEDLGPDVEVEEEPTRPPTPSVGDGLVIPSEPRSRYSVSTSVLADGGRILDVTMPKSKRSPGYDRAKDSLLSGLRSVAKGQRWQSKYVQIRVTLADGREVPIGAKYGYRASKALAEVKDHDGDIMKWAAKKIAERYPAGSMPDEDRRIINIEILNYYQRDAGLYGDGRSRAFDETRY